MDCYKKVNHEIVRQLVYIDEKLPLNYLSKKANEKLRKPQGTHQSLGQ